MPTVTREDSNAMTLILNVHIAKEDYEQKVNAELNKFRKKAHLKGFRKGQVPMSYVKKIYGKSVIADELNNLAYRELMKYISDNEIQTIGQPLPVEGQVAPELEIRNYIDYDFQYEIGLQPSFEVKGLDKSTVIDGFEVGVGDDEVEKEIENFRRQRGKQENVDEVSSENDLLYVNLIELEGDEPKEDGLNKVSIVAIRDIENEELKQHILTLKTTDTFDTNIHDLVSKEQAKNINKHFLYVDEDVEFNDTFRVEITGITSVVPAEITAQLLIDAVGEEKGKKYVEEFLPKEGEKESAKDDDLDIPEVVDLDLEITEAVISDEEVKAAKHGLMNEIRLMLEDQYNDSTQNYALNKLVEKLEKENDIELPEGYLKRWLEVNNEGREVSEKEYEASRDYLRNSFLMDQVAKQLDVYVSFSDIEAQMREDFYERSNLNAEDPKSEQQFQQFYNQLLQYDESFITKRQARENSDNIKEKIEDIITINKKKVSTEEFAKIIEEENEAAKKAAEEKEAASVEEPVEVES